MGNCVNTADESADSVSQPKRAQHQIKNCVIVLGFSINPDGSIPETLRQRILGAKQFYDNNSNCKVVVTGGDTARTGITEAERMQSLLVKQGIPEFAIWMEKQSVNTVENAYFCIPILKGMRVSTVTLLTSNFHMPRAKYIFEAVFKHLGIDIDIQEWSVSSGCVKNREEGSFEHDLTFKERLHWERKKGTEYVNEWLQKHIRTGLKIPPLGKERLEKAMKQLDDLLELAEQGLVD